MRLRLVHTLSLSFVAAVVVAVLAMGGVMAWNLRSGFADYLAARDIERLELFAAIVGENAERAGGAAALPGLDWPALLREHARREGVAEVDLPPARERRRPGAAPGLPGPPARPDPQVGPPGQDRQGGLPRPLGPGATGGPAGTDDPGPAPGLRRPGPPEGPPGWLGALWPQPPPPPGASGFGDRLAAVAPDGSPLFGHLQIVDAPVVERPVQIGGRTVARVRLLASRPVPGAVEVRFLRTQYLGIAGVAAALVLLALAGAAALARHWVGPLLAMQAATARIARGELAVRLGSARSDEIGDAMRNIDRMAEALQRLEGARRRWVADISHELRTPLAVLQGELEALVDGVRPLRPEAVLSLREEVLRMAALVADLHLLAMSDLRRLPCHFAPGDAAQLLTETVQRFALRAERQGLTLVLEGAPLAPLPVVWDAQRIVQLLSNLLDNSLRYTDAPGRIVLALRHDATRLTIDIDDSAPGVPPADLARLFEPLYRADAARGRHRGGSGLGLAICEAIARAHGGRLDAAASTLGGLRVRIELPLAAVAAVAEGAEAADSLEEARA